MISVRTVIRGVANGESNINGHLYRLAVLPRIGESFKDYGTVFEVLDVVHSASSETIELHIRVKRQA